MALISVFSKLEEKKQGHKNKLYSFGAYSLKKFIWKFFYSFFLI